MPWLTVSRSHGHHMCCAALRSTMHVANGTSHTARREAGGKTLFKEYVLQAQSLVASWRYHSVANNCKEGAAWLGLWHELVHPHVACPSSRQWRAPPPP
eukprot:365184-Chlamydomonas_euryale.AAC.4